MEIGTHKKNAAIMAIIALLLVTMGYLLDNDKPYENIWHTVFELSLLTLILFALQAILYGVGYAICKLLKRIG